MASAAPADRKPDPQVAEDRVLKGGWYTLWVILGITIFAVVDRQILTLAAAPLAEGLALSDSQLGMVQGLAFAIFSTLALYPLAWAADRFDRRIVLGLCILVWSLGTAACGLAQNFEQLFLAAIAIAAGEAGLGPIAMSIVPDLFKGRKRVLANALYYAFTLIGMSLGLMVGGLAMGMLDAVHADLPPALQSFEAWRLAFFVVALPAPIFLVLLIFARLRRPPMAVSSATEMTASGPAKFLPFARQHGAALLLVFTAVALFMLAAMGFHIWLPVTLTRLFGATPAENGFGMGLATGCGMVGGVVAGTGLMRHYLPRMGRKASVRIIWVALGIATPVLFAFPFVSAPWQGYGLMGLMMFACTLLGSILPNMLQDMAPAPLRARVIALYQIFFGFTGGIAPTLVGWVSDGIGGERGLLIAQTLVAVPAWIAGLLLLRFAERPFERLTDAVAAGEAESSAEAISSLGS